MENIENVIELTKEELIEIDGGIFDNLWEAIGYFFTYHAAEVGYCNGAPAALAYK
jgi:hypothetical protein